MLPARLHCAIELVHDVKHLTPHYLLALGLLLGAPSLLYAQTTQPAGKQTSPTPTERLQAGIRKALLESQERFGFPGASFAWVLSNGESGSVSIGRSGPKDPLKTSHTLFSGSIGKTYFSAVALQLVAEKKLDLDAKVSRYLGKEEWFTRLPNAEDITVRQLMNHTSGISEHVQSREFAKALAKTPQKHWQPGELLAFALDKPALFAAGKGWSYADTNYIVLGMILESITGQKAYDLVQKRLLTPLKLRHTYPTDHADIQDLANGRTTGRILGLEPGWLVSDGKYGVNPQFEWCGGGFASTTLDLARWCQQLYSGKVIPRSVRADLLAGVPARLGKGTKYGLGVIITPTPQGLTYGHSGFMPGYISVMAWYVEHDLALALQFNTDDFRRIGQRPRRYLDQLVPMLVEFQKARKKAEQDANESLPRKKIDRTPTKAGK